MFNMEDYRKADYDIDPIYTERWSPRSFMDKDVPTDVLNGLFEAARWAPSSANKQPWRFVYAKNKTDRERFLSFIFDSNTIWCDKAPVLVAVISKMKWKDDSDQINPTHAFDTGAAWGFLALEATRKGLFAHGMGGFDRAKAKEVLNIPEGFDVQAIIAIGYQGEDSTLPDQLRKREVPSNRKKINEYISEGTFIDHP